MKNTTEPIIPVIEAPAPAPVVKLEQPYRRPIDPWGIMVVHIDLMMLDAATDAAEAAQALLKDIDL